MDGCVTKQAQVYAGGEHMGGHSKIFFLYI